MPIEFSMIVFDPLLRARRDWIAANVLGRIEESWVQFYPVRCWAAPFGRGLLKVSRAETAVVGTLEDEYHPAVSAVRVDGSCESLSLQPVVRSEAKDPGKINFGGRAVC